MIWDFKGQSFLITGAGRGLGRTTAELLAKCGARIAVCDLDAKTVKETEDAILKAGGHATAYVFDASNRASFMEAAEHFTRAHGPLDAVVNNAMLLRYEPIEVVTEEVMDKMISVGIKGSVWGAQAMLAHMDKERGGSIVNMASPVAEKGFPNTSIYSLVKGAIVTLTKALSAELGPQRVRVNAVAPGSVPTPGALGLNTEEEYARRTRTIPLRRLGAAEDSAEGVAFLLSPAASFINGEILHVDGGIAAAG